MMTFEEMLSRAESLGDDAYVSTLHEEVPTIYVCLADFGGFDEDWCETEREYDDEEAVEAFVDMVDRDCVSWDEDYRTTYHFVGYDVYITYESDDI